MTKIQAAPENCNIHFKPVILVTGCSSGIGLALAQLLHPNTNYRVVATARSESLPQLRKKLLENDRFIIRNLDITSETECRNLIKEISTLWSGVNILVNNAGISYRAVVEHMTSSEEQKQFATNYFGPVNLIREVMPHMRKWA